MKEPITSFFLFLFVITYSFSQDPFYINYTIDDGLPSNEVYDVEISDDDLLWITTDRGVCSYDSYKFTTYTTFHGLGDNVNFKIFKDSNGVLWFFGYNGKVTLYENGIFTLYQYNNELDNIMKSIGGNYVKEIKEGLDEKLYITCNDQKAFKIIALSKTSKPEIVNPQEGSSTFTTDSFCFYENTNKITKNKTFISFDYQLHPFVKSVDTTTNINFIYHDNPIIWYSDNSSNTLKRTLNKSENSIMLLEQFESTSIIKDYNNGYWVATRNKGILYIPNMDILSIKTTTSKNDNTNYIKFHEFSNHLLCGTSSSNLLYINTFHESKEIHINRLGNNVDVNQFQTVNDGKTLRILSQELEIKDDNLLLISEDQPRKSIVTANKDTIVAINNSLRIYPISGEPYSTIQLQEKIVCFAEDLNGNIWIGTLNGVYLVEERDYNTINEVMSGDRNSMGRISDIFVDYKNNIWVCTIGNGLFLKTNTGVLNFNSDNGLSSNSVNTLAVLENKEIWVATNNGLNLLNFEREELLFVESFDQSDGLNSNYINDIIEWNENIYIASPNGICYFPKGKISKPKTEIPLNIDFVSINGKKVNIDSLGELNYNQNKIKIKYTAIRQNRSNEKKQYRYKLIKNEKPSLWNYVNSDNVTFDKLEHGDYFFEINASNKFGDWNKSSKKLKFTILTHYSDTIWFKFIVSFFCLFILLSLIYYFFHRYQQRKAAELALEEAKTKIREAELLALRNQMNPHFIFNSLNTVQNFIFKKDVTKANYLISKFSSLIRKSLNYSRLEAISIVEEIDFLSDYIELEKVRFPDKINVKFTLDNRLNGFNDKIPSLLLQPLIENAIKHGISKSTQSGYITVAFTALGSDYIKILITNTADVFLKTEKKNDTHISLGHQIIKDRIHILNSSGYLNASFKSNFLTKGYQVSLILPRL